MLLQQRKKAKEEEKSINAVDLERSEFETMLMQREAKVNNIFDMRWEK